MAYEVGVSSGFWSIGKDPSLLGLASKAGFIATAGVTVNQVDLETMSEFIEPKVKENFKRVVKELGLKIGLHAEIGELSALESAERRIWEQAHNRMVETVKNAVDFDIFYINFHLSSSMIVQFNESQSRLQGYYTQVVTPDGKPFFELADRSKAVKDYVFNTFRGGLTRGSVVSGLVGKEPTTQEMIRGVQERVQQSQKKRTEEALRALEKEPEYQKLPEELKRQEQYKVMSQEQTRAQDELSNTIESPEFIYNAWKKTSFAKFVLEAGEIDAYVAVAKYMKEEGDVLWREIAKNKEPTDAYVYEDLAFNAAVAARYIEGHLKVKDHPANKKYLNGKSVLEYAQQNNVVLAFEVPEGGGGREGLYRLFDPRHSYWFTKKINSPVVKLCIDFEHLLTQRLDPYKFIPELPDDVGKQIFMFHLGEPKPYHPAHIPIPLGSQAQEIIYEWIFSFRRKGFKNGVLMFERGGGRTGGGRTPYEVFEQSVTVIRLIAKYLEQDTPPDKLPMEFYGISEQNAPEWARQKVAMREHAWDPLEGLLSVPEEKHTFMSRAAVEKQKGQEWEKRKLR